MPFTFSHPAIVLPFTYLPKKWYSLTGLIIGSMTPDFEYFLRMRVHSSYSHTSWGMLWLDLPLGILLAFIFHNLVRNRLFENLPVFLRQRLMKFNEFNWNVYFGKNWPVVILSVLIGAASHILWDSFTHEGAYFVRNIPFLTREVHIPGMQVKVFKLTQHFSTLGGALFITLVLYKLPLAQDDAKKINSGY